MKKFLSSTFFLLMLCFMLATSCSAYVGTVYDANALLQRPDGSQFKWTDYANTVDTATKTKYGANCKAFVNLFVKSVYGRSQPSYAEDHRCFADQDPVGQFLNVDYTNGSSIRMTSQDVENEFLKANIGDVVQMIWLSSITWHTAIIADIEFDGVRFLHANSPSFGIRNELLDWQTLAERYNAAGGSGGFSIYRYGSIHQPELPTQFVGTFYKGRSTSVQLAIVGSVPFTFSDDEKATAREIGMRIDKNQEGYLSIIGTPSEAGDYYLTLTMQYEKFSPRAFTIPIHVEELPEIEQSTGGNVAAEDIPNEAMKRGIFDIIKDLFFKIKKTVTQAGIAEVGDGGDGEEYYYKYDYDNFVLTPEQIAQITELDLSNKSISSLVGINYFTALKKLNCSGNQLTTLDVRGLQNLVELNCTDNFIQNLYVFDCPKLETLICKNNTITGTLDVSGCTALASFDCSNNNLQWLNMNGCVNLEELNCSDNSANYLYVADYPKLKTLECWPSNSNSQLNYLIVNDCTALESLSVPMRSNLEILSLKGCSSLKNLDLQAGYYYHEMSYIKKLDLSGTALTSLDCNNLKNELNELIVDNCTELKYLSCQAQNIQKLDVSTCPKLEGLYVERNNLAELDVSNNVNLVSLDCPANSLKTLTIGEKPLLSYLNCYQNQLTELDVSNAPNLLRMYCNENQITELDVSNNTKLEYLDCCENQLQKLEVNNNPNLEYIGCTDNQLLKLDLDSCTSFIGFEVYEITSEISSRYRTTNEAEQTRSGIKIYETGDSKYPYQINFSDIVGENPRRVSVMGVYKVESEDESELIEVDDVDLYENNGHVILLSEKPKMLIYRYNTGITHYAAWATDGNYYLNVKVTFDDDTVRIGKAPVIMTESLPDGEVLADSTPYHYQYLTIISADGTLPMYFEVTGLPDGLLAYSKDDAFSHDGRDVIAGNPKEAGDFDVNVKVWNAAGETSKTFKLHISGTDNQDSGDNNNNGDTSATIPAITTSNLKDATVGEVYSYQLSASGTQPIIWSIEGLPSGLECSSDGLITGTPSAKGLYELTIKAKNDAGENSVKISLNVKGGAEQPNNTETEQAQNEDNEVQENQENQEEQKGKINVKSFKDISTENPEKAQKILNFLSRGSNVQVMEYSEEAITAQSSGDVFAEIPDISVELAGIYIIPITFSKAIPAGTILVWYETADKFNTAEISSTEKSYTFLDSEGNELSMPLEKSVSSLSVAAYLEANETYNPVIASEKNSGSNTSSSGGGCNSIMNDILILLTLLPGFLMMKKNRRA